MHCCGFLILNMPDWMGQVRRGREREERGEDRMPGGEEEESWSDEERKREREQSWVEKMKGASHEMK